MGRYAAPGRTCQESLCVSAGHRSASKPFEWQQCLGPVSGPGKFALYTSRATVDRSSMTIFVRAFIARYQPGGHDSSDLTRTGGAQVV